MLSRSVNTESLLNINIANAQAVGAGADVLLTYNTTIDDSQERNLLDQRDYVGFIIKSTGNNIPSGSTIKINYYGSQKIGLIGSETLTLPEITKDVVPVNEYYFNSLYTRLAEYFTLEITLKKGTAYIANIDCLVKKKIVKEPLVNVAAPTTATIGSVGDVIIDTSSNEWRCINVPMTTWNQTANYIWALADRYNFPAANTEYISHYDTRLSKIVHKRFVTGTTTASLNTSIAVVDMKKILFDLSGGSTVTAAGLQVVLGGYSSGTIFANVQHGPVGTLLIQVGSALYSTPYEYSLFYTK